MPREHFGTMGPVEVGFDVFELGHPDEDRYVSGEGLTRGGEVLRDLWRKAPDGVCD